MKPALDATELGKIDIDIEVEAGEIAELLGPGVKLEFPRQACSVSPTSWRRRYSPQWPDRKYSAADRATAADIFHPAKG
jgi:hypothetical protein